ncbi:G1/S-specific cyclin-D1 [Scyliorhinus canicula]|uniref:G1/S-specific cyclin-D1 n=1 Tax=Scyliorhinus canicula TaxID=7830 RepID=UPI0018F60728|nr:G1/S-specific cyclin-D1 [Scyliorhinus canicula]
MEHQLLCCEGEPIRRAYKDSNLINDRVLQTMLRSEENCLPSLSYFKCVQKEILPSMRKIVATWMLEVCAENLQMELLVLNKLKWDLASVTPHDFIEHFLSKLPIPNESKQIIRKHAQTFVALCATDVKFISNPPSMIAAGSMAAAVHGLHLGNSNNFLSYQPLTDFLSQIIKCDPDCLRACQEQIESLLETSLRQVQHNSISPETKTVEDELDLSCTPTDVRDVNL